MKYLILLCFLLNFSSIIYAQKGDFKITRDSLRKLSCKPADSITVFQANLELLAIDTNLYDTNLDLYYRDLGWSFYRMYLHSKDTILIHKAIESYKKAEFHKANNSSTLWQISFLYFILKECALGKYYLEEYKKYTEEKFWKEDQIKSITKKCGD